jgi:hypothetical protein
MPGSSNRNRNKYLRLLDMLLKELSATLDAELRLMQRNPCVALQLSTPPTTVKTLKVAYHNMARKYHPGVCATASGWMTMKNKGMISVMSALQTETAARTRQKCLHAYKTRMKFCRQDVSASRPRWTTAVALQSVPTTLCCECARSARSHR